MKPKLSDEAKKYFREAGSEGGKISSGRLNAKQRKERARQAGIASGKARKKTPTK